MLFQQAGQAVARVRELFHWQRFAGHRGLGDEQVLGGQYAAIGRNHVSGRQHDVVAGHQLADRQVQQACRATAVQVRAEVLVGHIGGPVPGLRRSTRAVLPTSAFSRSAARFERPSCTKRISVDSNTIAPITTVALMSSVSQDTAASTVSSRLNGLR